MIRVTIIETPEGVLYTTEPFELSKATVRVVNFDTTQKVLNELQNRHVVCEKVQARTDGVLPLAAPCPPGQVLTHETYDNLKRLLMGHVGGTEARFIREELIEEAGTKIPLQFVHDAYCMFCERNGLHPLPIKKFGKVLRDRFNMTTKQTTYKKKNVTCLLNYKI